MLSTTTIRTLWVFVGTVLAKWLGIKRGKPEIESIFNYVKINDTLSTSGQPTVEQFTAIRDAGFQSVINLLPSGHENSLDDEAEIVRELGLDYTHIPVDFKNPTAANFDDFTKVMQASEGRKIWVHCAVNARVSVFVARYRRDVLGEAKETAHAPISEVWEPFGVWKGYLQGRDRQ
ncbi:MAG: protein tyrosine phosphatase family protein [Pseudomonadota bacterium]